MLLLPRETITEVKLQKFKLGKFCFAKWPHVPLVLHRGTFCASQFWQLHCVQIRFLQNTLHHLYSLIHSRGSWDNPTTNGRQLFELIGMPTTGNILFKLNPQTWIVL